MRQADLRQLMRQEMRKAQNQNGSGLFFWTTMGAWPNILSQERQDVLLRLIGLSEHRC